MDKSSSRFIKITATVLALIFAQLAALSWVKTTDSTWVESPAERDYKWSPVLYRAMSFGHWPAAVDSLLIRFLGEDPAYSHVAAGVHPPAYYDLDLATDLDPAFIEMYTTGAALLAVIRSDGAGARDLLQKGMWFIKEKLPSYSEDFKSAYWGTSWQVPFDLAYVYLFELKDYQHAGQAFTEAAKIPGVPNYIEMAAKRFNQPGGAYLLGLNVLKNMLSTAKGENSKLELEHKLHSLEVQYHLFRVTTAAKLGHAIPPQDPWGGTLTRDPQSGKITTSTPYDPIPGLEQGK